MSDDLEHEAVVVRERNHLLDVTAGAASGRALVLDPVPNEPLHPEADRAGQDREGDHRDLARADPSAACTWPREERHDAPRRADLVTVVEVVRLRIVEVDRALHEPEAEDAGVEVDVTLRIAGDRGDVVDALDFAHGSTPNEVMTRSVSWPGSGMWDAG